MRWKNLRVSSAIDAGVGSCSGLAASSLTVGGAEGVLGGSGSVSGWGESEDEEDRVCIGDGGRFWIASSTLCSNSSWVIFESEVWSIVSIKDTAPI